MAVKIRLKRRGRKKLAMFDVIVADGRSPRDGKYLEKIGTYNPNSNPASIEINDEKALDWVLKGAVPTDTVRAMLSYMGVMYRKHLQIGVLKGAISQEEADKKFAEWKKQKEASIQAKRDRLEQEGDLKKKTKHEAEKKVKEARAEAVKKKKEAAEKALVEEIKGEDEAEVALAEEGEEAVETLKNESTTEEATEPATEKKAEEPKEAIAEEKAEEPKEEVVEEKAEEPKEVSEKKTEVPKTEVKETSEAPAGEPAEAAEPEAGAKEAPESSEGEEAK